MGSRTGACHDSGREDQRWLKYSLNPEKYLRIFLENGEVPRDDSVTERAIRPFTFTIGRANWHIIDTIHGAQVSAVIYSLVETASQQAEDLRISEASADQDSEAHGRHQPGLPGGPAALVGNAP